MDGARSLFRTLRIQRFRGFRELSVENLGRTNLFMGANNVGKTALLESLFLLLGSHNPEISVRLNHFRGIDVVSTDPEETWGWHFHDKELSSPIVISAIDEEGGTFTLTGEISQSLTAVRPGAAAPKLQPRAVSGQELSTAPAMRGLKLRLDRPGAPPLESFAGVAADGTVRFDSAIGTAFPLSVFLPTTLRSSKEDAERFARLEEMPGRDEDLVRVLRSADSRVRRISAYSAFGSTMLRADIGAGRLVPLAFMGQGFLRILSMVLSVMSCQNGCVLIDEIENGVYHTAHRPVWRALIEAARAANVQIFATTHSQECMASAHAAAKECLQHDLSVYRLERADGDIRAVSLPYESLDTALEQGWEVR
jgi:hypothetical protein